MIKKIYIISEKKGMRFAVFDHKIEVRLEEGDETSAEYGYNGRHTEKGRETDHVTGRCKGKVSSSTHHLTN